MDLEENIAKIIEKQMKEIQRIAEKFENEISEQIQKSFILNKKLENTENEEMKEKIFVEIEEIKLKIKQLQKEKKDKLGTNQRISFCDDHRIKSKLDF